MRCVCGYEYIPADYNTIPYFAGIGDEAFKAIEVPIKRWVRGGVGYVEDTEYVSICPKCGIWKSDI